MLGYYLSGIRASSPTSASPDAETILDWLGRLVAEKTTDMVTSGNKSKAKALADAAVKVDSVQTSCEEKASCRNQTTPLSPHHLPALFK